MRKTDEQLVNDYLEGDEKSLSVLVDRYLSDIYNLAFRLTNDLGAAEDIAQESFIKAWKNIRQFSPKKSFRGWLFAIARNTAIDFLRKKRDLVISSFENEMGENYLLSTVASDALQSDELLARAEDEKYVAGLLARLNPKYREVLKLRYSSDLTFEEIGEILKRPLHTVKSQYRRAISALRRAS
ncbi:MAG: sigma-70 family RNA polymerase sigma factor [Candidatus Paceibacterota bacterium]|jgi:RNA polymerase sigma-70 factor (ECF subfamily)